MKNSRESEQLNIETERHDELYKAIAELTIVVRSAEDRANIRDKKVDEMYTKVEEMYKVFNNGSFLVKVTQWGFGLLLALGGAYLMIKSIINGQN
jgi:hypothetical protein